MAKKKATLTQKNKQFPYCLSDEEIVQPIEVMYSFCDGTDLRRETNRLDRLLEAVSKSGSENNHLCYDLVDTEYRRLVEAAFLLTDSKTMEEISMERFLGLFAHEIKTQLSGASLALDAMIEKTDSFFSSRPDIAYYLTALKAIIFNSNQVLSNMITTVHFREEFFALRVEPKTFRVADLIEQCIVPFYILSESLNKSLVVELNELGNKSLISDVVKMRQIIQNFLSNAYKYSTGKEIQLVVTALHNQISFSVVTYGHTISPKDLKNILKIYYQAKPGYAGDGVGLYLCELYAEMLHGNIVIASNKGITSFTVNIPCEIKD